MFNVLRDGPFRYFYLHCGATDQLILTLCEARSSKGRYTGRFVEFEGEDEPVERTLREWKSIARKRIVSSAKRLRWCEVNQGGV